MRGLWAGTFFFYSRLEMLVDVIEEEGEITSERVLKILQSDGGGAKDV